ncbi:hypothetical protein GPECTOR_236g553 [Gonium pectorale]|uniref:Uncharacterized protein n=1 Tax=Gonium pectorale TaxID=33097 RepID=A0A150FWH0_GONPE|nr:hypothetical protein GPECTOR_236g553 [Gonium pectorale]|eukprot:KXZ41949.1 hypothetical protein GPECTOR_236g553 [Gonium pectorale]
MARGQDADTVGEVTAAALAAADPDLAAADPDLAAADPDLAAADPDLAAADPDLAAAGRPSPGRPPGAPRTPGRGGHPGAAPARRG